MLKTWREAAEQPAHRRLLLLLLQSSSAALVFFPRWNSVGAFRLFVLGPNG